MTITVVGTVAFDAIQTPFGKVDRCLGGSATYFSVAASFFTRVNLVAVVGDDFTDGDASIFAGRDIDLQGLERVAGAKSFFWSGEYGFDLNVAKTRDTQLNVFENFKPRLDEQQRRADILFLANAEPKLQLETLEQAQPKIVALDTMNLWIATAREDLTRVFRHVDLVIINDAEVRQYTNESNVIKGARQILDLGVKTLVIKRGEYGVLMMTRDKVFAAPAYPLETVFDPTGAGDTFAGALLGYLANAGATDASSLRRALVTASAVASFCVEDVGTKRLRTLTTQDVSARLSELRSLIHVG